MDGRTELPRHGYEHACPAASSHAQHRRHHGSGLWQVAFGLLTRHELNILESLADSSPSKISTQVQTILGWIMRCENCNRGSSRWFGQQCRRLCAGMSSRLRRSIEKATMRLMRMGTSPRQQTSGPLLRSVLMAGPSRASCSQHTQLRRFTRAPLDRRLIVLAAAPSNGICHSARPLQGGIKHLPKRIVDPRYPAAPGGWGGWELRRLRQGLGCVGAG